MRLAPVHPQHDKTAKTASGERIAKSEHVVAKTTVPSGVPLFLQAKLTVNRPGDAFEQEADRIADSVVRMAEPAAIGTAPVAIQRKCAVCEEEEEIQTKRGASSSVTTDVAAGAAATKDRGEPLSKEVRSYFEPRLGYDFSHVRVHADERAASAARSIQARAYTHGHDIVFGAGEFAPMHAEGRRLLAHELTHVVQQRGGHTVVQRQPTAQPAAKTDVSIVLSDADQDMAEGGAYAKTVLRVTDVADAAAKIKALGVPIGKLFVVSHSSSAGQVQFSSSIGTVSWVPIRDLANALKGAATIDEVDFRGCKLGSAGGALESFRQTIGAQSTKGSTCWTFIQRVTPLTVGGVAITSPSQIPRERQAEFNQALLQQIAGLKAANGTSVKDCLVGLAKGERANANTLDKIWKLYFANNGNLVASWGSPEYNEDWQQGSICSKDMTAATQPCAIVEAKAPAPTPPAGGKKTSALDQVHEGIEVGDAPSAEGPQPEEIA